MGQVDFENIIQFKNFVLYDGKIRFLHKWIMWVNDCKKSASIFVLLN